MIKYQCPKCGTRMESPDSLIGQNENCPICEFSMLVPPDSGSFGIRPSEQSKQEIRKPIARKRSSKVTPEDALRKERDRIRRKAKHDAEPVTERQMAFAEFLGLPIPPGTTMVIASEMIAYFDQVKHYIYGLWKLINDGHGAFDCGLPQQVVKELTAKIIIHQLPLARDISKCVGEKSSSAFLKHDKNIRETVRDILTTQLYEYMWQEDHQEEDLKACE